MSLQWVWARRSARAMRRSHALVSFERLVTARGGGERGSAVVEFLGVSMLLLVPLVYLVLTLGQIQGAVFAGEGAAREAGRVVARADSVPEGLARARTAVELAFADQGLAVDGATALSVTCEASGCAEPGSTILVTVRASVPLPGVPEALATRIAAAVPVEASYLAVRDAFRASG